MDKTVDIIINASVRLRCTVESRTRALLIYHKFKQCISDYAYDNYLVAAACLSLSVKQNEEHIEYQAIILTFFSIVRRTLPSLRDKEFNEMCKSVCMMEILILRMVVFTLNYTLPFDYLKPILSILREPLLAINLWDSIIPVCFKLICDFHLTKECLKHKPEDISLAAVFAALTILGADVAFDCYLLPWLKAIGDRPVTDLTQDMVNTYTVAKYGREEESQSRSP